MIKRILVGVLGGSGMGWCLRDSLTFLSTPLAEKRMSLFDRLLGRDRHRIGHVHRHERTRRRPKIERDGRMRRRIRWVEAWQSYPGAVGDSPALWSVDLGAIEAAPLAHLPVRLDVEVDYPTGAQGLPADGAILVRAEDAVRAIAGGHGGAYVGRVCCAGVCRFTAHLATEPSMVLTIPGGPQARATVAYDPHWAYVRDALAPDERQHQLLTDLAAVEALSQQGDRLATPRTVEHFGIFAEQVLAEDAAVALRAAGFAAIVERDGEGEFELTALRSDPVAPPTVHEVTWRVKETVERHGGTYDGWDCPVAPAA